MMHLEALLRLVMEKSVQCLGNIKLNDYPIRDLVNGWFLRVREVSNGVYEVEGIDTWGHKVSRKGTENELDEALKACAKDARQVQSGLDHE